MEFKRIFSTSESPVVEFKGIKDGYLVGSPVEVHCIFMNYVPNVRDWLGLFRVGWTSQNDYFSYFYAPMPKRCINGKDYEANFKFSDSSIPNEDGVSYQFVYISSDKRVLGVSNSFQFKDILVEDFSEYNVGGQSFVENKICSKSEISDVSVQQELIDQLKNEILRFENNLLTSSEKIAQFETELSTLQNGRKDLLDKLNAKEKTVLNLSDKYENLNQEKVRLATDSEKMENCLQELTEKLEKLENTLAIEKEKHSASCVELREKRIIVMKLTEKVKSTEVQIKNLLDKKQSKDEQISNMQDSLKKQNSLLESERKKANTLVVRIDKSDERTRRLQELLQIHEQKQADSCRSLKTEKKRSEELEKMIEELKKSKENEEQNMKNEIERLNHLLDVERKQSKELLLEQQLEIKGKIAGFKEQVSKQKMNYERELKELGKEKTKILEEHAKEIKLKNAKIASLVKGLGSLTTKMTYDSMGWA